AGDLPMARAAVAPLVDRFPNIPAVQRVAGLVLYASGDPLSAAAMLEGAARAMPDDKGVAITLVASYAALNKAGRARRTGAAAPGTIGEELARRERAHMPSGSGSPSESAQPSSD